MGEMAATISTSLSERPICVPIGDKVELRGTTRATERYLVVVRLTLGSRAGYHRMCPVKIFGHSKYVGHEGAADSLRDGGNAQIRLNNASVWVKATNSANTSRHGNTVQVGSAREDRRELLSASHICYWWRRGVGKFVRRGQDERPNSLGLDEVSRQVRHRLRPNKRHQCLRHSPHRASSPLACTFYGASLSPAFYGPMSTSMPSQMLSQMLMYVPLSMATLVSTLILISMPRLMLTYLSFVTSYGYSPIVSQTPTASLFYRCGSLEQQQHFRLSSAMK
ncbi:hypothetical protein Goklo_012270 [Gossypium klotzschianum]|uniref:Uncharacterized protein n=1 Tax=Gossypium klotzschianum TaxID=34286 RepID=A0A7J8VBN2_9ROSI|nr:hypothetical protein [Gossypium klotzschianum]